MSKPNTLNFNLEEEMKSFNNGNHYESYKFLGNKKVTDGIMFNVWAPNAMRVAVIGDFSTWHEIEMTRVNTTGLWSVLVKNAHENQRYKYRVYDYNEHFIDKIDPFAQAFEIPPKDASIVKEFNTFEWHDDAWLRSRSQSSHFNNPINIYEVHMTSWMQHHDHTRYSFYDLADRLIPYVKMMNYTHIELMPVMEHPLDASWGYQITGYFAVAGRFGDLDGFAYLVNKAHQEGIGVLLDWVPSHFCINQNALAYYDGTPTYEYQADWQAQNQRWGTLNFDLGKNQVRSFLISNALYWIEEFHVDGIRVDAVSNMLYRDYDEGYWEANEDGSNHNIQGVQFLQKLNTIIKKKHPDVMMIAEESTAWKDVTGGQNSLGFDYKWNMGWMNDTLNYFQQDSFNRNHNFNLINFNFVYMHDENFILPLSHDEVVHGKKSLLGKLDGSRQEQFEQLRLLQTYMITMPGKKLNFMGNEIGQFLEWRFYEELEWNVLNYEFNSEYQKYIKDLNGIYLLETALHYNDVNKDGISVISGDAPVLVFSRIGKNEKDFILCVHNFSHDEVNNYSLNIKYLGTYEVILNSALEKYGGYWTKEHDLLKTKDDDYTLQLDVPAMSSLIIKRKY